MTLQKNRSLQLSALILLIIGMMFIPTIAQAQVENPEPIPPGATFELPFDPTVPYLPGYRPICESGNPSCFTDLETLLRNKRNELGCNHDAVFADSYLTITEELIKARDRGFFQRPDRINHEARQYAQEYFDQFDKWHTGSPNVSPSWAIAFQAADDEAISAYGDLLIQLNAHIRRDNPIRAVEQTEGVLRLEGEMPEASGRKDHDNVSIVLRDSLVLMMTRLAERYDPTINDGTERFSQFADPRNLYALISEWREESWRSGELLRKARANGGVEGVEYQLQLQRIEEAAEVTALAIRDSNRVSRERNAERNAYCAAHNTTL